MVVEWGSRWEGCAQVSLRYFFGFQHLTQQARDGMQGFNSVGLWMTS